LLIKPGYVRGYTDDIMARSATLALAVRRGLVGVGLPIANYYARNGIISRTDMGGFNLSDVPVVMVELGNMKNSGDALRMTSVAGRNRYAAAPAPPSLRGAPARSWHRTPESCQSTPLIRQPRVKW